MIFLFYLDENFDASICRRISNIAEKGNKIAMSVANEENDDEKSNPKGKNKQRIAVSVAKYHQCPSLDILWRHD
jgi:hypothetical protein